MVDPLMALIVAAIVGVSAFFLLRPVRGLIWRWLRAARNTERVLIEDALKHIYDCEAREQDCTLESLCGAMGLSADRTVGLVSRLQTLALVAGSGGRYALTPEGRSYALRVIRIHRLWERYLSEETGLSASEWHEEAHVREHTLSPEEADALAASMGFPRYDPHGDPIPTRRGEIAPPLGRPLSELAAGEVAEIVHIEDEPPAVFAQLAAVGLHPGMRVRVIESSPKRVRFEADADEHVLAPVFAANLSVVPLPAEKDTEGPFERLSALSPGEQATVVGISARCRGPQRRRMLDLGIVPGTRIKAEMRSPGGDPTAYRIRGAVVALRREQADLVHVERAEKGAAA